MNIPIPEARPPQRGLEALAYGIVETVREPLLVLDGGLRVQAANPAFYRTFQVSPAETLGRLLYTLGNGQWDLPALRKLLEEALPQRGHFEDFPVEQLFPRIGHRSLVLNGRRVFEAGSLSPNILLAIEDVTGQRRASRPDCESSRGDLAVLRDITEAKRGDEARRQLQAERDQLLERLQLVFDRMPIGWILTSPESRFIGWNPAAEKIFGFTRDEALGRTPYELIVTPANRSTVEDIIRRLLAGDMAAHTIGESLTKGGGKVWCEWYNTPLRRADGAVDGMLSMVIDATQRHHLEEQCRQAQKMEAVGRLAGGVAHDFNNLLTIINGYSELLLGSLPADSPARSLLAEIKKAGERSAALTRQLLAFSRRQFLAPRVLDLKVTVGDIEKMLRRVIGEEIELHTDLQPGLGKVRADAGQVDEVIMNLAVNARDAMPRGGRLTILTRDVELLGQQLPAEVAPGPYVMLAVADTGCGMSPEVRARIFEPFFTTKEVGQGIGLGLATVYGIVKQSGGHIDVASQPGRGTTFRLYLPRAEEPDRQRRSEPGTVPLPGGKETVLLVEDEDVVRSLSRFVLEGKGYTVLEARNGEEALRVSQGHAGPIHLLVSDVVMPQLGGRPLAERLAHRHPGMKVLYLLGYTDDAVVRHGVQEDEVNFLQKPYSPTALAAKVREVLDSAGAGR